MKEVPGDLYFHLHKRMRSKRASRIGLIPSLSQVSGDDRIGGRTTTPPLVEHPLFRLSPLTDTLVQARLIPAEFFVECRDCIISVFSADTGTTLDIFVEDEN